MTSERVRSWGVRVFEGQLDRGFHLGYPAADPFHFRLARISCRVALIHDEVSEALQVVARGRKWERWYGQDGKPEGLGAELADVVMRLLDLAHGLGMVDVEDPGDGPHTYDLSVAVGEDFDPRMDEDVAAALSHLHSLVSRLQAEAEGLGRPLAGTISRCVRCAFAIAEAVGIGRGRRSLWAAIEEKHDYNRTRPLRHGGKTI